MYTHIHTSIYINIGIYRSALLPGLYLKVIKKMYLKCILISIDIKPDLEVRYMYMYLKTFLENQTQKKTKPNPTFFQTFFLTCFFYSINLFTNIQEDDISPSDLKICHISKTKHVKLTIIFL